MNENRIIFHVDVNSAFLSWTAVDRLRRGEELDIRDVPSIIGGDEALRRGVVLAKSVPAKAYGIVTGESIYSARRKCPEVLTFRTSFEVYKEFSCKLMSLLGEYTPIIEQYSIDECFMDMTNDIRREDTLQCANGIKERVKEELGFTVNVGVSTNKLLAKMASELKKPDKVNTLYKEEIKDKLWPLSVGELFMVGRSAKEKLNRLFIYTIGELAGSNVDFLVSKFKSYGRLMWEYANGIDESSVNATSEEVKIISNSATLSKDLTNIQEIRTVLVELCENVTARLRKIDKYCTSISISIRTKEFKNYSHQKKLKTATDSTREVIEVSNEIFNEMWRKEPIRLLGVQLSGFSAGEVEQLSLFEDKSKPRDSALDKTIDLIREKYGDGAVKRSILINSKNQLSK